MTINMTGGGSCDQGRDARQRQIRKLIQRREREGLTYAAISAMSGIPISTLAWWKRQLDQEARPALVEVEPTTAGGEEVDLAASSATLEVELSGGRRLRAPVSTPPATLAALVAALERPC